MMSWRHQTFYSSTPTRQFSFNNLLLLKKKFDFNNFNGRNFYKLRVVHPILRCRLSKNCSKQNIFPPPSLQKDSLFGGKKFINPCSIQNLFGDDFAGNGPLIPLLEKLSRKFASLLLLGVLTMMVTALVSRDSAVAASNARMGGRISNSRSSPSFASYAYPFNIPLTQEKIYGSIIFVLLIVSLWTFITADGTILMLQVGILDKNRELLRKLYTIAQTADMSTPHGLIHILNDVSKALLQHYDSCHFAYLFKEYNHAMEVLVRPCYRKLSIRERTRYAKETFRNVDGIKSKTTAVNKVNSIGNEYTVVTVLVLARGKFSFPSWEVKRALRTFCSIPIANIQTVQVFWSPQGEGETISERQLRKDFPLMQPFKKVLQNINVFILGFQV